MAGSTPPPPGVHQISSSGARVAPVDETPPASEQDMEKAARARARGRRIRPGEDVIADLARGKRSKINPHTPQGTKGVEQDIVEVRLPTTKRPIKSRATFTSVDGSEYSFRLSLPNGKKNPDANILCAFTAMRELMLGGNPLDVFDAFKLKIHDADDKLVYPFSEETLRALQEAQAEGDIPYVDRDDEEASAFTLGEDD